MGKYCFHRNLLKEMEKDEQKTLARVSFEGNGKMASGLFKKKEHTSVKEEGQGRVTGRRAEMDQPQRQHRLPAHREPASMGTRPLRSHRAQRKPVLGVQSPPRWLEACAA